MTIYINKSLNFSAVVFISQHFLKMTKLGKTEHSWYLQTLLNSGSGQYIVRVALYLAFSVLWIIVCPFALSLIFGF